MQPRLSLMLPLPSSLYLYPPRFVHPASQSSGDHTLLQEGLALKHKLQEIEGINLAQIKDTGHLQSGFREMVRKVEARAREKLLSRRWSQSPWTLEFASLIWSDYWGNGPGWGQTVLAQFKL